MARLWTYPKLSPAKPKAADMGKTWFIWIRFQDPSGKLVQKRYKRDLNQIPIYSDRMEAAAVMKEAMVKALKDGWNPLTGEMPEPREYHTLGSAVQQILTLKSKTLKPKSKYAYTYICKLFTEWCEKKAIIGAPVELFNGQDAQRYMDWLAVNKGYSGRTFNDHLIILRVMFNCFIQRKWVTTNPFSDVSKRKQSIGRNVAFTDRELADLDNYLKAHRPRLYYFKSFIYHAFIRRTELTYLKVKHVNLSAGTIIIPGEAAKNGCQESVVIPPGLRTIIEEMNLPAYPSESFLFGRDLNTCDRRYMNPNGISTLHNTIVQYLGISSEKGLYSHKHTGVCHYYHATGKDVYALMRQLRHRDLNTTMIYLKSLGLVENDPFKNAVL